MITITIPVDKKLKAQLRATSKKRHLSMSAYLRLLIADAVLKDGKSEYMTVGGK